MARSQIVRRANFAYPWSERHDFYSPNKVRTLVGASGLVVLLLVLLPFYMQHLRSDTLSEMISRTSGVVAVRDQAAHAGPAIRQMALVDSIRGLLEDRLELYREVDQTEYRMDALIVHLAEQLPDGVTLRSIDIRPPLRRNTGRAARGAIDAEVPEELLNALALSIAGSARNSTVLDRFREALVSSPLFDAVTQDEQVLEEGLTFTITARLPGSGHRLGEGTPP